MDETRYEPDEDEGIANKKYTFFIIDGSPAMFETSKEAPQCEFLIAVKLILNEIVRVCCSQSLNNHFGVILTSTKNSETEGLENSTLLVPMGVLGQDEVNSIKDIGEQEDVKTAVEELSGGHHTSDLSNAINYCKRVFSSCPNTRHQSVIYLTNNRNPFGRDDYMESSYFKRTRTAVNKIIGHGQRKTLGEFSVIMLPQDGYKPQNKEDRINEPWYQLDTEVFNTECDAAARIRQKTTAQRSHANVTVNLGPGVNFDVSVFSMVMEAKPLSHSQKYTHDTEEKIVKTSGYVTKQKKFDIEGGYEDTQDSGEVDAKDAQLQMIMQKCKVLQQEAVLDRRELKKSITIGGETIILNREQFDVMSEVETKGLNVVGFVPLDRVDREISIISPKIIQPNDQTTLGSTRIYRALLDRCWARQQAIIAKYQSRKGQKMRIVALVPFKKDMSLIEETSNVGEDGEDGEPMEEEDKKPDLLRLEQQRAQADSSEWLHEGFMLIGMPFREEVRDELSRFEQHQSAGGAPELETPQVDLMKKFVKRLTMSYNPSFYENPRLLSERAALCLEATGEELIERRDTLEPYYQIPKRLQRVGTEIEQIMEKFGLEEAMKEKKVAAKAPAPRKRKVEYEDEGPAPKGPRTITVRQCLDEEKMGQFKKDELLAMAVEHCEAPKTLAKKAKADIIIFIEEFLADNPQTTWNLDLKK